MEWRTGIAALVVVLILGVVVSAAVQRPVLPPSVSPPPKYRPDMDYVNHGELAVQRIDRLAQETGGDFSKLSEADQQWLDGMTAGHGADMFRKRAEALKQAKTAKMRARPKPSQSRR
jgi:hypothetical protein